jgi:hypothetical protein
MNKKCVVSSLIFVGMLLSSIVASAVEFKGVVGVGSDFGGDVLLSGTYTSGSTWEAKANEGLLFNAGVVMVTGNFETQGTVGYKFGGPQASNGSVTFTVVPVEVIEFYRAANIRAGIGLSYHSSPTLEVSVPGFAGNGTYNFNDAMGTVIQIGWAPTGGKYSIDLRMTSVNFKQKNVVGAKDINGNTAGIYASYYF